MHRIILILMLIVGPASAQVVPWAPTSKMIVGSTTADADSSKVRMLPAVTLPPFTTFYLDTVNLYRVNGQLRSGLIAVDSTDPFRHSIDREDDRRPPRTPFRVWVYKEYSWPFTNNATLIGAVVGSPMDCPLKTPWDAPFWNIRWSPPDTAQNPNIIAPLKVAYAAAAQLPVDSLRKMAKLAMEIYIRKIPPWPMGQLVYTECYGPLPPP